MFALIDCNNFYVSCERLFRPDLAKHPVIVLSNNDGCIISRSNEAKALGIQMGAPYFKVRALCEQYKVQVFSSNYTLYGDLSNRVMCLIIKQWPHVEVYSIDEAFLDLSTLPDDQLVAFCTQLQQYILKATGIPTSIGIGKTKTLAKAANAMAKKTFKCPVFNLNHCENLLQHLPIDDVWGIGRRWADKLVSLGIHNAAQLANMSISYLNKKFSVVLARTAMELSGIRCSELAVEQPKKSIISSKSFGVLQTDLVYLLEAISSHCARAHEKMRHDDQVTNQLTVFIQSPRFRPNMAHFFDELTVRIVQPTDDLRVLTRLAREAVKKIFKPGVQYQKVGVMFHNLTFKNPLQDDLWNPLDPIALQKTEKIMSVLGEINQRFGRGKLRLAAEGYTKPWSMKREKKSPNYTTQWSEFMTVK